MSYSYEHWVRRRNAKRVRILEYLLSHPCVDCGESDLRVLDFDHIDPAKKIDNVTRIALSGNRSWEKVELEIKKCVVRCSNCHRKKTIGTPEWFAHSQEYIEVSRLAMSAISKKAEIQHGTRAGYIREIRSKLDTCQQCREANNIYTKRKYYENKKGSLVQ